MTPLVLSDREAAKLLRCDRSSTLQEMKRRGELAVIPWGRGSRITLESVQALARRGWTEDGHPVRAVSRPRRAGPSGQDVAAAIRAIRVEDRGVRP